MFSSLFILLLYLDCTEITIDSLVFILYEYTLIIQIVLRSRTLEDLEKKFSCSASNELAGSSLSASEISGSREAIANGFESYANCKSSDCHTFFGTPVTLDIHISLIDYRRFLKSLLCCIGLEFIS